MVENRIKIEINEIGSIKHASFNVKDLTGILGLPNTGKGYILRSIYWFFQLLDDKRYQEIKSMIRKNVLPDEVAKFEVTNMNKSIEEEIKNIVSEHVKASVHDNITLYNQEIELNYELKSDGIMNIIKSVFTKTLTDYVNTGKLGAIKVNGKNINTLIKEAISESPEGVKVYAEQDKRNVFTYYLARTGNPEEYYKISRALRKYPLKVNPENVKFNFSEKGISANFNLKLIVDKNESNQIIFGEPYITGRNPILVYHDFPYTSIFISEMTSRIVDYLIDFYLTNLRSSILDISGLSSVKFIPYGRNIIVQLFNNSAGDIYEPMEALDVLSNLKNAPFSTYFKWLNTGKSSLKDLNDDIKRFFEVIMRGNIENDKNSGELKYRYSKDGSISLNLSSAMVEEITGIMLPVISSNANDLIIIEEPEAQLHITTQIIMGIFLIYISRKMNIKIIFSTHSDTMAFVIQHIITNNIGESEIIELIKKIYKEEIPKNSFHALANKPEDELVFYYIDKGNSREVSRNDMKNNIPGITDVIDDLFNWAFDSLKNDGDKN